MSDNAAVIEQCAYAGWPNCVRLTNGSIELIATTDVGPRIIRFGFVGGDNLFCEFPDMVGRTGGDEWRIYGGHRLWHAPEVKPRTYQPDNTPVAFQMDAGGLSIDQPAEPATGIAKHLRITVDAGGDHATVLHRLTNHNPWKVELAPWALSVMRGGGRAILPQEPFQPHTQCLLPARPVVLWSYTDMSDPRWTWGKRYIQLRQDPTRSEPQKIGVRNTLGWAAYAVGGQIFIKRFDVSGDAVYPDMGSNCEIFTNETFLEVESLGPLTTLEPGACVEHIERWSLVRAEAGTTEDEIDRVVGRLTQPG